MQSRLLFQALFHRMGEGIYLTVWKKTQAIPSEQVHPNEGISLNVPASSGLKYKHIQKGLILTLPKHKHSFAQSGICCYATLTSVKVTRVCSPDSCGNERKAGIAGITNLLAPPGDTARACEVTKSLFRISTRMAFHFSGGRMCRARTV